MTENETSFWPRFTSSGVPDTIALYILSTPSPELYTFVTSSQLSAGPPRETS